MQNYYKRKPENDKGPKELKYGEVTLAHTSPFLGTMTPGQTIQAHILHICLPLAIFVIILNSVRSSVIIPWRRARPFRNTFSISASFEPYLSLYGTQLVFPSFYHDARPDHTGSHSSYLPPMSHICHISFLLFLAIEHQAIPSYCTLFISASPEPYL